MYILCLFENDHLATAGAPVVVHFSVNMGSVMLETLPVGATTILKNVVSIKIMVPQVYTYHSIHGDRAQHVGSVECQSHQE